ncbi:transglutaminase domain-containing protein [Leucobacter coleopterorum]|uniref:Transglutaminase domain-containing protein n=2 Tax=Leucobacter coleopterorum TaxID=2714933 RepID=A0ABX6JYG4_9MICO|nr:transglutaminase domain-containing protein [Leucobacter coleopterorum]
MTGQLWWVVGAAGAGAFATVLAGWRWRWGSLTIAALIVLFVVLVVPLAVPSALNGGALATLRGVGDGLASVALGWKQLLTLTLPVGSYQTVLVPLFVVMLVTVASMGALALRGGRWAPFAAIPMMLPVLFGTIFGASNVSDSVTLGSLEVAAPRELALWLGVFCVGAIWVAWSSGMARRAALRLGRDPMSDSTSNSRQGLGSVRRNAVVRAGVGVLLVCAALVAGLTFVPVLDNGSRSVARDAIDPELVVRKQTSPLAGYRVWKRDALLATPVFSVSSSEQLPARLRIAVLDRYDGVDFTVGDSVAVGRFSRYPSGESLPKSSRVRVEIDEGYEGVWVPLAMPLGGPPSFGGNRANKLADSFYVNRDLGSAVAVPTTSGLRSGDSYSANMAVVADAKLGANPAHPDPQIDVESMPELDRWLRVQQLPSTGEGLSDAVQRLRDRGYLSHSLTSEAGERDWLTALPKEYGTKFVPSPGGHSIARIEQVFKQLNDQQQAAGERAKENMLVAGIGDDEQFATAAALIARTMGFDSRVVLGVRLGGEDDGVPGVPACQRECTGDNIAAWVEARGSDGVWAPLDVTPQVEIPPTTLEEGELLPEYPSVPEERDATESDPPVGTSDSEATDTPNKNTDGLSALWPIIRVIGLSLATLLLIALPLLFLPFVKRSRSRRRRGAASAEIQTLGAWDEVIDLYADTGMRVKRTGSRRETATQLGLESGDWIAWTVDRAVYAPEGIRVESAQQLWQVVDGEIAKRLSGLSGWKRLRARYSLASFGVGAFGRNRSTASSKPQKPSPSNARVKPMETQP